MSKPRPSTVVLLALAASAAALSTPVSAQVDPNRVLDAFERAGGKFEGFRRSGAKGVCARWASFVGSARGPSACRPSSAFSGQPVPVVVRFSVGGANPKAPDNARSQRNLALQFNLPGGETWQMGNISAPVFGAATPEQFIGRLESLTPDPDDQAPQPRQGEGLRRCQPRGAAAGQATSPASRCRPASAS